jgi:hypothetical protein
MDPGRADTGNDLLFKLAIGAACAAGARNFQMGNTAG